MITLLLFSLCVCVGGGGGHRFLIFFLVDKDAKWCTLARFENPNWNCRW